MNTLLQKRWLIDATLFAGFLASFFVNLTGVGLHQWLGLAAGALAVYHLISHQNWVSAVARQFFGKTSGQARLYFLIDALLLAGFGGMFATGLVISTWLNLTLVSYHTWRAVHIVVSVETLLVVVLKIGLHWRWIVAVGKRIFARSAAYRTPAANVVPMSTAAAERRSFLKLMAGVGAASLLAVSQPFQNADTAVNTDESSTDESSTGSVSSAPAGSAGVCAVQCGRRCSYPGHCRRYVDHNSNGRCDLGECQG